MQKSFTSRAVTSAFTFIALASLAACGGGGDAAPAVPVVAAVPVVNLTTVSPTEAQRLTGRAVSSLGVASTSGSVSNQLYTTATSSAAASGTEPCPLGGTASYSRVDADNNGRVTAGDTITLSGSNCRFSQSGITGSLDGSLSARVLAVTGTPYSGSNWSLSAVQTNTAFTVLANGQSVSLNGIVQIDDSPTGFLARFNNLSVRNGISGNALTLVSGDITGRSSTSAATALTVVFSNLNLQTLLTPTQNVNLAINTPATGLVFNSAGQLVSGSVTVTTGTVRMIATATGTNQVRLDTDNNSDGVIDATQTLTWTALVTAGNL